MKDLEFLRFIVESLVDNKEDIQIERTKDELWVLITLKVNKADMGVIIWKNWNIVSSIRSLLRVIWAKNNERINLKVLD